VLCTPAVSFLGTPLAWAGAVRRSLRNGVRWQRASRASARRRWPGKRACTAPASAIRTRLH